MNDPYVYESTDILINKFGIKNADELNKKEYIYVSLNIVALLNNPIKINSVFDILTIHKKLFSDVYEWAGEVRTINIYKEEPLLDGLSVRYADFKEITKELERLDERFKKIKWNELSKIKIINELVEIIPKLWKIHCFREGNTRTITTFLYLLMKQSGLKLNSNFIGEHAKYFRNSLVICCIDVYSEPQYLESILLDSISFKTIEKSKYKTIREYEVDKYEYKTHKYKE